ncbi:MAG: tRNA 2-thiouridine(34) synthase MnmA [Deltaproteobacteria bacterium]|jgi:tRNA-specific 2-thiouridylase|nr:tRNA 2-thiouridine(34) synthase MnmA [Deltaproteobacteria bacterium]
MARVLLAMSGGVDSSTAAYLLQEMGHEVSGATMRLLDDPRLVAQAKTCCSPTDIQDARQAATKLNCDFWVFNFRSLFHHEVIKRFAQSYARGLTPNPCLDCNRYLKFRHFWERARLLNNEFMATGHYARVERDGSKGRYLLKKALDLSKDQSYVLYALTQTELAQTLFPLGQLTKAEVRRLAASLALDCADKPDSQDICFVPEGRYVDFLAKLGLPPKPGDIVDRQGQKLGQHKGLSHYTIGQRRGLGLCRPTPYHVLELDPTLNRVVVGSFEDLAQDRALIEDCNFIALDRLTKPLEVTVKIRYRQTEVPAEISPHPKGVALVFKNSQKAVTPGQAAVFYQGEIVLGGGTISRIKI